MPANEAKTTRLIPLDSTRGLIMALMALDHANAFIARGKREAELWLGEFPSYYGDTLAFLTRFVTHLAAPGFFFLMGASMALLAASRRQAVWGNWRIIRHFLARGALLILLQFILENPAWKIGGVLDSTIYIGVLYALGGSMIISSLLLRLSASWIIGISTLLILSTEILLPDQRTASVQYGPALRLWLLPGYTPIYGSGLYVLYPLMPWLGVTGLGMAFGRWLLRDREKAYRGALWLGAVNLIFFIPMRLLEGFGNIRPILGDDWIALLNVVKSPPSLTFLLITLGGNLLLLGLFARTSAAVDFTSRTLAVFGRTPLFFYVTHLYLYALLGRWIAPDGIGILRMYPYWLLGLALLFPLCWFYGSYKHSHQADSPWRFL